MKDSHDKENKAVAFSRVNATQARKPVYYTRQAKKIAEAQGMATIVGTILEEMDHDLNSDDEGEQQTPQLSKKAEKAAAKAKNAAAATQRERDAQELEHRIREQQEALRAEQRRKFDQQEYQRQQLDRSLRNFDTRGGFGSDIFGTGRGGAEGSGGVTGAVNPNPFGIGLNPNNPIPDVGIGNPEVPAPNPDRGGVGGRGGGGGGGGDGGGGGGGGGDGGDDRNPADPEDSFLDNDDLNGECFVSGELGELEEFKSHRTILITPGINTAVQPNVKVRSDGNAVVRFICQNAIVVHGEDARLTVLDSVKIAYIRFLAVRSGLVSPAFSQREHHVKYNECVQFDSVYPTGYVSPRPDNAHNDISRILTAPIRKLLRENFTNMTGCVAYMFRVRGHHFLADMEEKYKDLWRKCLKAEDDPGLKWEFIAQHALHAIFPRLLDDYWRESVIAGNIAGALVKRVDSAPAGVAAIKAVYAGAQDLQMAVPGIQARFQEHFDELEGLVRQLKANRWAGSINRKFYNSPSLAFDEQKFGAIAAVVRASLETFAPDSPLLKSQALKRVSGNARLTGGIVTRGIATAATDPSLVKKILNIGQETNSEDRQIARKVT